MNKNVVYAFCFKSLYAVPRTYGKDKDNILYENFKAWLKRSSSPTPFSPFSNPYCILLSELPSIRQSNYNCSKICEELPTGNSSQWQLKPSATRIFKPSLLQVSSLFPHKRNLLTVPLVIHGPQSPTCPYPSPMTYLSLC